MSQLLRMSRENRPIISFFFFFFRVFFFVFPLIWEGWDRDQSQGAKVLEFESHRSRSIFSLFVLSLFSAFHFFSFLLSFPFSFIIFIVIGFVFEVFWNLKKSFTLEKAMHRNPNIYPCKDFKNWKQTLNTIFAVAIWSGITILKRWHWLHLGSFKQVREYEYKTTVLSLRSRDLGSPSTSSSNESNDKDQHFVSVKITSVLCNKYSTE